MIRRTRASIPRNLQGRPKGIPQAIDLALVVVGTVLAIDSSGNRLTVAFKGGSGSILPMVPATYLVGRNVFVLVNPLRGGRPEVVLGPVMPSTSTPADGDTPSAAPPAPSTTVTKTVTITPTWSGTYRTGSGWDRWNVGRDEYGGRSTLYQGNGYGSGDVQGLAVYGDQIANLNATAITAMVVTLRGASLDLASYPAITVRAATNGTKPAGAPTTAGTTSNGSPGKSGIAKVALDSSLFAGFAAGTYKGLALTGASYNAVRGTSAADGMALKITYTTAN